MGERQRGGWAPVSFCGGVWFKGAQGQKRPLSGRGGGGPLEYKTRDEVISGKVNREKVSQGKGLKGSTKRGEEEEPEV